MLGWTQSSSLGEQHVPEKVINTTLEVEETVAEEGREAVFPGIRRDRAHGNLIEASRRSAGGGNGRSGVRGEGVVKNAVERELQSGYSLARLSPGGRPHGDCEYSRCEDSSIEAG